MYAGRQRPHSFPHPPVAHASDPFDILKFHWAVAQWDYGRYKAKADAKLTALRARRAGYIRPTFPSPILRPWSPPDICCRIEKRLKDLGYESTDWLHTPEFGAAVNNTDPITDEGKLFVPLTVNSSHSHFVYGPVTPILHRTIFHARAPTCRPGMKYSPSSSPPSTHDASYARPPSSARSTGSAPPNSKATISPSSPVTAQSTPGSARSRTLSKPPGCPASARLSNPPPAPIPRSH